MLKEVFASNIAKLVAACVCPVVGATAVALKVPPVRSALHKATAPKEQPERQARAKPRMRKPVDPKKAAEDQSPQTAMICPQPIDLDDSPLRSASLETALTATSDLRVTAPPIAYAPANCPTVRLRGGGFGASMAAVPEPATWAQMVAGFALIGGALRVGRRRHGRVTQTS